MNRKLLKNAAAGSAFMLPALILYVVLMIAPIFQTIRLSFFSWNGIPASQQVFVGLENFRKAFADPNFWHSLRNILWFCIGSIVIEMPLAFTYALIINSRIPGYRVFRVAYFLPVILPITAVGLMWTFVLYPTGALNVFLNAIGLSGITTDWLGNMKTAVYAVIVVNKLVFAGQNMLIFSAGMTAVPEDVYEAAAIDGATAIKRLFHITIPLLKSSFKIFLITAITGSIRMFDIVYVMTGGGPNGSSDVPATLLYFEAFRYSRFGYASAIGVIILVLSLGASIILNKAFSKEQ